MPGNSRLDQEVMGPVFNEILLCNEEEKKTDCIMLDKADQTGNEYEK